jgi:hypothetical protein
MGNVWGGYCLAAYKGVGITTFKVPMKNLLLSSVLMMAGLWVSQPRSPIVKPESVALRMRKYLSVATPKAADSAVS